MQPTETLLSQYQQALLRNPKDLDAQIMCGYLCVELGKFEEAAGYFWRIVRVLKTNQNARNALCYCLEQMGNTAQSTGNFIQAEACFAEALEYQPGNAIHWYNLGNAQRDLANPQAALYSFVQSIRFNPNDADAHNNCGNVQRELGQLDKAITSYKAALQLNPRDENVYIARAVVNFADRKWPEAEAELRALLKQQPDSLRARVALARVADAAGDGENARRWLNEALTKDKTAADAAMTLASIELKSGRDSAAKAAVDAFAQLHCIYKAAAISSLRKL